jgi:hypothetical protein
VEPDCHYLCIELFDESKGPLPSAPAGYKTVAIGADRSLGTVLVPLSHLSVQSTMRWYPVGRSADQPKSTGVIELELMLTRPIDHSCMYEKKKAVLSCVH